MSYLVDTNVVSEVRRSRAERQVMDWWDAVPSSDLFLSVLVVGEIRVGIERLRDRDPGQSAVLEDWLDGLRRTFHHRVIAVDTEIADAWGRMNAAKAGSIIDGLMAATAIVHDLTFVTRNVKHVAHTGVRLLNPWDAPPA